MILDRSFREGVEAGLLEVMSRLLVEARERVPFSMQLVGLPQACLAFVSDSLRVIPPIDLPGITANVFGWGKAAMATAGTSRAAAATAVATVPVRICTASSLS